MLVQHAGLCLGWWKMVLVHPGHKGRAAAVLEHIWFWFSQGTPEQGVFSFVKIF